MMRGADEDSRRIKREAIVALAREYKDNLAAWIREVWGDNRAKNLCRRTTDYLLRRVGFGNDDVIEESPAYAHAIDYFQKYEVNPETDPEHYAIATEYAKVLHERCLKTDATLDEKADAVIKYLGGGSALITFGALLSLKTDKKESMILGLVIVLCLIPSLLCAVMAIILAMGVRRPRESAIPPGVDFAVKCVEGYENKAEAEFNTWLILHPICVAAQYRNVRKARQVEKAHWFYVASLGLLLVPIVGVAITLALTL